MFSKLVHTIRRPSKFHAKYSILYLQTKQPRSDDRLPNRDCIAIIFGIQFSDIIYHFLHHQAFRENYKEANEKRTFLNQVENSNRDADNAPLINNWTIFDNGAFGDLGYYREDTELDSFSGIESFAQSKAHLDALRTIGQPMLVLDVMGQGKIGVDLGADQSIGWTLSNNLVLPPYGNRQVLAGDLTRNADLKRCMHDLDRRLAGGSALGAVFFRAVGGFTLFKENKWILLHLYQRILVPLYARAEVGARFYLNIEGSLAEQMTNELRAAGVRVRGPSKRCYVIEKQRPTLPSLEMLLIQRAQ